MMASTDRCRYQDAIESASNRENEKAKNKKIIEERETPARKLSEEEPSLIRRASVRQMTRGDKRRCRLKNAPGGSGHSYDRSRHSSLVQTVPIFSWRRRRCRIPHPLSAAHAGVSRCFCALVFVDSPLRGHLPCASGSFLHRRRVLLRPLIFILLFHCGSFVFEA